MRMIRARLRAVRTDGTADDGFTLVELMVAMFVISFTLLGLMGVQVQALESVGESKQRQQATALANRTMEQLRALPYDTVSAGLNSGDLAGDPNVQSVAGVLHFQPVYDAGIDEVLQTSTGQAAAPLFPHVQDETTLGTPTLIGNVQYDVRTYVSRVDPTADNGFHLTVVVAWSSAVTGGQTKTTAVRSRLFSPQGCSATSTATRPFAGPCQAFFYSDAGAAPAGITVTPVTDGVPLVVGTDVLRVDAKLPSMSVRTQSEQIVSAQSVVTTSVASITNGAAATTESGGDAATSAADTDPANGTGTAPSSATPVVFSGSSSLNHGAGNGSFAVNVPAAASGSALSTTTATSTPPCSDDAGTALVTNQACSTGNVNPNGTYSVVMDLNLLGRNLDPVTLASIVSPGAAPWRAYGARAALPVAGHCTGTSGIGCVAAGSRRAFGVSQVGRFPGPSSGDTLPTGFTAMATLDGFSAVASAESGIAPGAGTASRAANTLTYWNGSGYSTATLGTAAASYPLGVATGAYKISGLPDLTITMSGTVEVDSVEYVSTGAAPCETTACTVTSTVGTVRVSVQYDIQNAGVPLGSFVVTSDLGSTIAQTTYKAAPSA